MGLLDRIKGSGRSGGGNGADPTEGEGLGALKERIADGFRGKPDVDLAAYADSRGLERFDNRSIPGILAAFPMHPELQFNVLAGELPGGEYGTIFHEVRMLEEDAAGTHYGVRTKTEKLELRHLFGLDDPDAFFKAPYTKVAVRLPEAQGILVGFRAARKSDGGVAGGDVKVGKVIGKADGSTSHGPGYWLKKPQSMDNLGCDGWMTNVRACGDTDAFAEVVAGPLCELLSNEQPSEFRIEYRFGALILSQQYFAKSDAQLDALAEKASALAAGIRRICERLATPLPLEQELPEPAWAELYRNKPKDWIGGGDGQDLGSVGAAAEQLGLRAESEWEFSRGSSDLGIPGEPFGVMRGPIPGIDTEGRLVTALERRVVERDPHRLALDERYQEVWGCDAVLLPARGAEETPIAGEPWGNGGGHTVRRGIFTAWRPRSGSAVDASELESLVTDAVELGRSKGLI